MVECNLAKVEVAGSNPVSRSSKFRGFLFGESPFFCIRTYLPDSVPLLVHLSGGFPALLADRKKTCHAGEFPPFFAILGYLT